MAGRSRSVERWVVRACLATATAALVALTHSAIDLHLRAASVLLRFAKLEAPLALESYGTSPVGVTTLQLQSDGHTFAARRYSPARADEEAAKGSAALVLVHGVHHLGMDEPRLIHFAQTLAASGIEVLTPHVPALADYRLDARVPDVLAASTRALQRMLGLPDGSVGLAGLSFSGGLCLLTAATPSHASAIRYVVTVGAHESLPRLAHFFGTDRIAEPDGRMLEVPSHPYGALVLVHSYAERFFPGAQVDVVRTSLAAHLRGNEGLAEEIAGRLPEPTRAEVKRLLTHRLDSVRAGLVALGADERGALERLSPHEKLGALRVPVLLLHGANDPVVPATESAWLERAIPPHLPRRVLVTPALGHVELTALPATEEKWALLRFVAHWLELAGP